MPAIFFKYATLNDSFTTYCDSYAYAKKPFVFPLSLKTQGVT